MDSGYGYQALLNQSDVDASRVTFTGLDPDSLLCTSSSGTLTTAVVGSGLSFVGGILVTTANAAYYRSLLSAGTGIGYDSSTGVITNTGVVSITGTSNQVVASAATGAVTLSLPQDIGLTSNVQFGNIAGTLTTSSQPNIVTLASVTSLNSIPIGANTLGNSSTSLVCGSLRVTTSPAAGRVLTSDASGNATWVAPTGGGVSSITGTANQVIASASTGAVTLSTPQSIGTSSVVQFGQLGVGGAPVNLLDVFGNVNGAVAKRVRNTNSGSSAYTTSYVQNDGASACHLFLNSSTRSADGGTNTATLRNDAGGLRLLSSGSNGINIAATTGNVGIGVAAPNAPLQLAATVANRKIVLYDTNNNDHQYYGFGVNNNILRYQVDITGSSHVFYAGTSTTTSTELMRITGTGRVGINNTNPSQTLDVQGVIKNYNTANDVMLLVSPDSGNYIRIDAWNNANSVQKNIVLNQSGGNVGIGVSAPTTTLQLWNGSKGGQICLGQQNDPTPYMNIGMDTSYQTYICNNAQWTGSAYNYANTGGYGGRASRICQEAGNIYFDVAYGGANPISWDRRLNIQNSGAIFAGGTFNAPTINGTNGVSAYQKNGTNLVTMTSATSGAFVISNTGVNWNHGLGGIPDIVQCYIECITIDMTYPVGSRLMISNYFMSGNSMNSVGWDGSQCYFRCNPLRTVVARKDTGGASDINQANWRMYFKAFRII